MRLRDLFENGMPPLGHIEQPKHIYGYNNESTLKQKTSKNIGCHF